MLRPAISHHEHKSSEPAQWRVMLDRIRERRWTAHEDEPHPLHAMLHWRDPYERLRDLRRRRHGLDNNPSSG